MAPLYWLTLTTTGVCIVVLAAAAARLLVYGAVTWWKGEPAPAPQQWGEGRAQ